MKMLSEGLRRGDLRGLVKDLLSVDHFQSKVDDSAIVVAFYARNQEVAKDLNRFIQKGAYDLLDTEVSPAPNSDGDYLVFVELELNKKANEIIGQICQDVSELAEITKWIVDPRKFGKLDPTSPKGVKDILIEPIKLYIKEFFGDSSETKVDESANGLVLKNDLFDDVEIEVESVTTKNPEFSEINNIDDAFLVQTILGSKFRVVESRGTLVVENKDTGVFASIRILKS